MPTNQPGRLRRVRSEFGTATIISAGAGFDKDVKLAGGGSSSRAPSTTWTPCADMADVQTATVIRCVMEHEGGFDLNTDERN